MPKDPTRNQPNYKIGGYHINEYDFEQNHGRITDEDEHLPKPKQNVEDAELSKEEEGGKTNAQSNG